MLIYLLPWLQLSHVDNSGQCAVVHAAVSGHYQAMSFLLQCDWSRYNGQVSKIEAMQQSLIVAAAMGHKDVSTFLKNPHNISTLFQRA